MFKKLLIRTRGVFIVCMVLFLGLGTVFFVLLYNAATLDEWFFSQYTVLVIFMIICYLVGLFFLGYLVLGIDIRDVKKTLYDRGWEDDNIAADLDEGIHLMTANVGKKYMVYVYNWRYHVLLLREISKIYVQEYEVKIETGYSLKKKIIVGLFDEIMHFSDEKEYMIHIVTNQKEPKECQFIIGDVQTANIFIAYVRKYNPDIPFYRY